jgi:membrane fusion protein, multidrug efflux system
MSSTETKREVKKTDGGTRRFIGAAVIALILVGTLLAWRAESKTNRVALDDAPKPVTVVLAKATTYRPSRRYVGTLRPWVEASVGPQFNAAYVETVLFRPGALVHKGDVLATLDCRNASAESRAIAAQASAIAANQRAIADESARTQNLLDGGFVSSNEAEQRAAQSSSLAAQLASQEATLAKSTLDVSDCTLRAPFDGEISRRLVDPGAFVRPGAAMLVVVDRRTIRMTADAPEDDFAAIAPGTRVVVAIMSTHKEIRASITRRAPAADPGTRTVHFEIDLADPDREIPVDTTGVVRVEVGEPVVATEIPIVAASITDAKATIFVVHGDAAHAQTSEDLGEIKGGLYFEPSDLPAGTEVVTEGRALLHDGERVTAKVVPPVDSGGSVSGKE